MEKWKKIWKKRFKDPITDAETFDYDRNFFLKEIGKKPQNLKQIKGQYMGIIGVSHIGWKKIKFFIEYCLHNSIIFENPTKLL